MMLKENDELKRKYEELQKRGRLLDRVRRIVRDDNQEEKKDRRKSPAGDRRGRL